MQDPRFVSSPYVCMQNILIPNEYDFLPVLNSYVCRIRQSIPNWNTLFKKGCASAAAQMSPHSTGIASQYPRTIYSKLEYFVQKRLCICCSADVAAFHRHRQLVLPSYNLFQTGILCSKKAVHLRQRRCCCIPQASLVSTLVPYPSWGMIFVYRPYFTLFLSTKKFVAG